MNIPDKFRDIVDRYMAETPVRLGALASDLGLNVFKASLKPGISGLIEPCDVAKSGYRIRINRFEPVERQRFTLAHEIAHFLLHRQEIGAGVVDDVMFRSSLSDRKEVEANKLASSLIMPDAQIRKMRALATAQTNDEVVAELSKKFRVSQQAMRIKLGV